ncbi:Anaphase-promoting complex subunit 8 [Chlorella vulgaris]
MHSRRLEDDRSGPPMPNVGPTARSAAARAAGELALAVLAPPGPPQLAVVGHLEQDDKLNLGATCTSLRHASLAWFPEVTVEMVPGKIDAASLAAWLERRQAQLNLITLEGFSGDDPEWHSSTIAALPTTVISSLTATERLPAGGSTLTALTKLSFKGRRHLECQLVNFLRPLSLLRQLSFMTADVGNTAAVLALPALQRLHALGLHDCRVLAVPRALSQLTSLTSLDLSENPLSDTAPLAALHRLKSLDLSGCSLTAVPQQLSALTALTRLGLSRNEQLYGSWQYLLPLTQLQDLDLSRCRLLVAVPGQLSALTALTRLSLCGNDRMTIGWQRLLPLRQLQHLDLSGIGLTAVLQQLSALTALTRLNLSRNWQLGDGWLYLLPLTQLQDLDLSRCRSLTAVPEQVSALTALTRLNLSANSLENGWQHLLHLTQLLGLDLSGCTFTAMPERVSALITLNRLDLSCNLQLDIGRLHLPPLTQLQDLNLSKCSLTAVPEQLSALDLTVTRCGLTAVPEQVSVLIGLTRLNFSRNGRLFGGWQHLLRLPRLRWLDLRDVDFPSGTAVPPELTTLLRLPHLHINHSNYLLTRETLLVHHAFWRLRLPVFLGPCFTCDCPLLKQEHVTKRMQLECQRRTATSQHYVKLPFFSASIYISQHYASFSSHTCVSHFVCTLYWANKQLASHIQHHGGARTTPGPAAAGDQMSRAHELRQAVQDCRSRALYASAKWAAAALCGLPEEELMGSSQTAAAAAADCSSGDSAYQLARSLFDLKEYRSAAHVLRDSPDPLSLFLRGYAMYLAGEKRKEEERIESKGGGAAEASTACNVDLDSLEAELQQLVAAGRADGEKKEEARQVLAASVTAYPCNWSAWLALQSVCGDLAAVAQLSLPDHFVARFFLSSLCVDMHHNAEALQHLQALSSEFPRGDAVILLAALAHYNLQNFDEAQELFEELLGRDPHRIEGMDIYSNILYVKEEFGALSALAHRCAAADKYRPETCCVIGNYYSLRGVHERAVQYFRRALRLNPSYLSAWTLMGHEYVELKNPPAAIEAYRRAVDVNPRDYRAWYGLGQTYELVNMPYYALYYFRRAVQLRPHDARMWNAMGHCYQQEQLGLLLAAIRCHRRALPYDKEGVAVHELAKLHERMGQRLEAAHYHRLNLDRIDGEGLSGQDAVEALTFLADFHKDGGDYEAAERYYTRLLDFGAGSKEAAKSSLREIRTLKAAGVVPRGPPPAGGVGGGGLTPVRPDSPPDSPGSDMMAGMSPY